MNAPKLCPALPRYCRDSAPEKEAPTVRFELSMAPLGGGGAGESPLRAHERRRGNDASSDGSRRMNERASVDHAEASRRSTLPPASSSVASPSPATCSRVPPAIWNRALVTCSG